MTELLANHVNGRWHTGNGKGSTLLDPVLGTELGRVDSSGIDLPAAFAYARDTGGAALRAMTYAQRAKLQDYIARNSARASTAKQAQSRQKALAKMQPIAAVVEDPTLSFDFPSPEEMKPPLITMDMAAVGYETDKPIHCGELAGLFPEFAPCLGRCRFDDCAHMSEPDCAVRQAVASGAIHPSRYESYRKMYAEAKLIKDWELE